MKVQDKTSEKQINEVEMGDLLEKSTPNNDRKVDPGLGGGVGVGNGGKYWEDARNFYQRYRRTKGQTDMNNTPEDR